MKKTSYYQDPIIDYNNNLIYLPSDDTYLIIDHIKNNLDLEFFDEVRLENINNILDMGTGTGIIAIFFLIMMQKNPNLKAKIFASDILEEAINCAKDNEKLNGFNNQINFIHSNLFDSFPSHLKKLFDIIIFNPPYLPSIYENVNGIENLKDKNDYCWNGGKHGSELFIEFLDNVKEFLNLKHNSYIYYISSSRMDYKNLNNKIKDLGYKNEILKKKHFFFEHILLNRIKISSS